MSKRIILCFDGTWNNPDQTEAGLPAVTKVYKIFNAIAESDQQLKFYHPGVGGEGSVIGEGGVLAPVLGGAFGHGIRRHICSGYQFLTEHYQEGDQIFVFGFSRGAFVARALVEFVGFGLLQHQPGCSEKQRWAAIHQLFDEGYQRHNQLLKTQFPQLQFFHQGKALPVRFLGVWDTVGALGIPDDLALLNLLDDPEQWNFYDNLLGTHVITARHAMAMDEKRASFTVTRWDLTAQQQVSADVKELWFAGVHSDVGGGYPHSGLADIALQWMMDESGACGLQFYPYAAKQLKPDPYAVLHDSYSGFFKNLKSRPRNVPAVCAANAALFHPSVLQRQATPPLSHAAYWPTRQLAPAEKITVPVYANQHWNKTGLYLNAGERYRFRAKGEWKDAKDACDWRGTDNHERTFGDLVRSAGTVMGQLSKTFRKLHNNDAAELGLNKRALDAGWFVLMGAIANDGIGSQHGARNDGSPHEHQLVVLPDFAASDFTVSDSGYLYCFSNDAWAFYDNNSGCIQLTVERVA
jgi:hypothetical protein